MSEIDFYIRTLFLREITAPRVPNGHARKEEIIPHLRSHLIELVEAHGASETLTDFGALSNSMFEEMVEDLVFIREDHGFAGSYYVYHKANYGKFREFALEGNLISAAADRVANRYFRDQFAGYMAQRTREDAELATRGEVVLPASDRVVFIGDNGPEVIEDIQKLREALRTDNDEDEKLLERRERLDSELSAGQELLKSPSVRIRAVMSVLITTLSFIAAEFAGGIIGDLAVKLLDQLRPLLGF